ncbi:hypothetical protein [Hyalangium minutum]|uniref:Uncharacterized protein n=1 Tax=Hyalangium minutum TaxID=394096 RepID=A0A085VXH5_9BACT|nr:hypothetical protein [Hyalangium minutum]KFE60138.1 hypothetical protein DB31_6009 [Hyalangium minutum]
MCGTTNWVCVSECIDSSCMDQCLREGCEQALGRLRACTEKAGCAEDDSECSARLCGGTCQRAFEPAPKSPEKEKREPCEGFSTDGPPPKKVVGRWELVAATLKPEPPGAPARLNPDPRPDYVRTLEVTPSGCFILRTKLEDSAVGQGNFLEVRSWGSFAVAKDKVVLKPKDGQAVGKVCGVDRVIGLSKGKFLGPRYSFSVEQDMLTLVVDDASKSTFQFQRTQARDTQEAEKP